MCRRYPECEEALVWASQIYRNLIALLNRRVKCMRPTESHAPSQLSARKSVRGVTKSPQVVVSPAFIDGVNGRRREKVSQGISGASTGSDSGRGCIGGWCGIG